MNGSYRAPRRDNRHHRSNRHRSTPSRWEGQGRKAMHSVRLRLAYNTNPEYRLPMAARHRIPATATYLLALASPRHVLVGMPNQKPDGSKARAECSGRQHRFQETPLRRVGGRHFHLQFLESRRCHRSLVDRHDRFRQPPKGREHRHCFRGSLRSRLHRRWPLNRLTLRFRWYLRRAPASRSLRWGWGRSCLWRRLLVTSQSRFCRKRLSQPRSDK